MKRDDSAFDTGRKNSILILPSSVGVMSRREKRSLGRLTAPTFQGLTARGENMPHAIPVELRCAQCRHIVPREQILRRRCAECRALKTVTHTCRECGASFDTITSHGREHRYCQACRSIVSRKQWLKTKYGLTSDEWQKMYDAQNGCCAICGMHRKALVVDHDHRTGRVRELLCTKCNNGLGMFNDQVTLFEHAIQYLRRHKTE